MRVPTDQRDCRVLADPTRFARHRQKQLGSTRGRSESFTTARSGGSALRALVRPDRPAGTESAGRTCSDTAHTGRRNEVSRNAGCARRSRFRPGEATGNALEEVSGPNSSSDRRPAGTAAPAFLTYRRVVARETCRRRAPECSPLAEPNARGYNHDHPCIRRSEPGELSQDRPVCESAHSPNGVPLSTLLAAPRAAGLWFTPARQ
jgi:hypothetical protein